MNAATHVQTCRQVSHLMAFYEHFNADTIARLDQVYTQDVEFIDPVHRVAGILGMKHYMKKLAANLSHYEIRYLDVLTGENNAYLTWEMVFAHKRLRGGERVTVRGMSHLKFTNRVYYHEDRYDLGALLYDNLPLLGRITAFLKRRLSGKD